MDRRRDAFAAVARLALEVRDIAKRDGGVGTVGKVTTEPGIATAVAGACSMTLDQRHLEAAGLASMLAAAKAAAEAIAEEERVEVDCERLWHIEPIRFDAELVELAEQAVLETAGVSHRMASGPLHDAASVALAGIPTVMLFVQSLRGLSHTREEDTRVEDIELSVRALDRLTQLTLEKCAAVRSS